MKVSDLKAGYLVKMKDGSGVLCDGESGGWILVGCGDSMMYHTIFYTEDNTLKNKANQHGMDFLWVFDARGLPLGQMKDIIHSEEERIVSVLVTKYGLHLIKELKYE